MSTTVVNLHHEVCDVYIGRPSMWGNPFTHTGSKFNTFKVDTREEAIAAYEDWLKTREDLIAKLPELRDKKLGCFCKPKACHGDVLARLADGL